MFGLSAFPLPRFHLLFLSDYLKCRPKSLVRNPGVLLHPSYPVRHHGAPVLFTHGCPFWAPKTGWGQVTSSSPCERCLSLWAAAFNCPCESLQSFPYGTSTATLEVVLSLDPRGTAMSPPVPPPPEQGMQYGRETHLCCLKPQRL